MDPKKTTTQRPPNEDGKIVTPAGQTWDGFFCDQPAVSEDYISERESQHQPEREAM